MLLKVAYPECYILIPHCGPALSVQGRERGSQNRVRLLCCAVLTHTNLPLVPEELPLLFIWAILGFILAILGLMLPILGLILAILGLMLAILGLIFAILGLILAILGLILAILGLILAILGLVLTGRVTGPGGLFFTSEIQSFWT